MRSLSSQARRAAWAVYCTAKSALHAGGDLVAPADAARRIVEYLDRDDFGAAVIDDLRHSALT